MIVEIISYNNKFSLINNKFSLSVFEFPEYFCSIQKEFRAGSVRHDLWLIEKRLTRKGRETRQHGWRSATKIFNHGCRSCVGVAGCGSLLDPQYAAIERNRNTHTTDLQLIERPSDQTVWLEIMCWGG